MEREISTSSKLATPANSGHHCTETSNKPVDLEKCQNGSVETGNETTVSDANIVTWDSPDDPENPLDWPTWLRWTLISLVSAMTFMAGLSSSMFAPSVPSLLVEFNSTNTTIGSLVVTIFVLGLATGPLFFAPLSELYGRTYVQHVGCVGFLVFTVGCALSTSLNMLIGMRLLQGTFAAVPLTNGGGIIADMVRQEERGFAMGVFTTGTLIGPIVGPIAGALLSSVKSWRWIFYVIAMALGIMTCLCGLLWRESYAPVLLARKAARLRKETGNQDLRTRYDQGLSSRDYFLRGIVRPIKMLIFSPILAALCLHMGLAYAYFYILFTTFTDIFTEIYHWEFKIIGLSFIGVGCGFFFGQLLFTKLSDSILKRLANKGDGEMMPEYRLPLGCIGGIFVPLGLFWYGWSVEAQVHWIVPILGTAVIGLGNAMIFISIQAYTIDAWTLFAASGLAANTVVRSVMAALIPLAAPKLYAALGLGWGNSLLAFLALAMVPVPVLLFFYGERMRGWNSVRMSTL
ncbi:cycloheximide resistance protein [Calycina marina]|uniref:Cycloheximide resistance protein n=1 Tax=Calycina marina TaxID=1763456 RepID=A0A9P7Z9X8_9HELO|nr:cycloheximide resistance protein [Calycina marina]